MGRIGTYRVFRLLGKGGMGLVFDAEDTGLQRRVALKVLRPEIADDGLRRRFLREARLAASLSSPHIAQVYQVGEHNGLPGRAMEFVHGESLERRLKRLGQLPVAEALAVARSAKPAEIAVIGGGDIYRQVLPFADRIYLSEVDAEAEGDTHFPELDDKDWQEVRRDPRLQEAGDEAGYVYRVLERRR